MPHGGMWSEGENEALISKQGVTAVKKSIFVIALLAVFALPSVAQQANPPTRIKVTFTDPHTDQASIIVSAVQAKLNLTSRYAVVPQGDTRATFVIDIVCIDLNGGYYTCATSVVFWPVGRIFIAKNPSHLCSGTSAQVADMIANAIINQTTDEDIKEYWTTLFDAINEACKSGTVTACTSGVAASNTH
jgi:hypothetical protein